MTQDASFGVVVVGGGPAGSTIARQLSLWGHSVIVLSRPDPLRPPLAESLPPSCDRLFERLGIRGAIDGAGFLRSRGNTVWWDTTEPRSESFAGGRLGYQVDRSVYDRVLLNLARDAGATILPALVRDVEVGNHPRITYEHGGVRHTIDATFVLDCSGRSGVVARQGLRSQEHGQRTLALAGLWSRAGEWDVPDSTHTLVESYGDGWGWSVPLANGRRYVTVMVDPTVTDLGRHDIAVLYAAELAKTHELRRIVGTASLVGSPWACDASLYTASAFGGQHFLLVGDAASFIDPLASFGVKKAMASAWVAAVVTHTWLTNPVMRSAAVAFYDAHERRIYESYREFAGRFYRAAATIHASPFWEERGRERIGSLDDVSGGADLDTDSVRQDPRVLAAFDALKRSAAIDFVVSPQARRVTEPAIRGHQMVLEDRLVAPGHPTPFRYARGVDLLQIVDMADEHQQVPDLFEAYNRACQPVILPDFLGALSMLVATGILHNRATG